ncbi:hypothetical protein BBJ28_00026168, partial [Nothophytophthora sp. Chile5]
QNESESRQQLIEKDDPELLAKLRECPDVDVFLPEGLRSFGYCEDAAAYTKFLESRMLPRWVLEVSFEDTTRNRSVTYHDLCPNTPLIFFNHYWDGLPEAADWPATKPLYLMPNMEMYELESEHYWRADVILCKTALCEQYLHKWFRQEGNPWGTRVLYTRHTTSNLALTIRSQLSASEADMIPVKNFSDVSFLHTAGTSYQKGTRQVLDCWLSRSDLPPLELYMAQSRYEESFKGRYGTRIDNSSNIRLHTGRLEPEAFAQIIAEARYVLCPSVMEGYGHYINQARSSRAFIFTTDVAPMNELITPSSGALIQARAVAHDRQFLGGTSTKAHALQNVTGFVADFDGGAVCDAVLDVLEHTTPEERARRADKALQQYYFDTVFFAQAMRELRDFARAKSHSGQLPGNLRRHEDGAETSLQLEDAMDKCVLTGGHEPRSIEAKKLFLPVHVEMTITPSEASGFTSDDEASSGGRVSRRPPFLLLLCLPMALALWAMSIELSWITASLDAESVRIQLALVAAATVNGDPDASWTMPAGVSLLHSESSVFYPDELFAIDWSTIVEPSEILHETALHRGCVTYRNSVIPWTYGRPGQNESESRQQLIEKDDPELLAKLRECPDVDIFLAERDRGFGYCEDAAAYTK